jgi:hypothetical protein
VQSLIAFPAPISEEEECMPLRKDQQDFIRDEVKAQIGDAVDSFKPHGWRRVTHFLREWGIAGAIITASVAMLAVTLGALYQSFSHVREETAFRVRTSDRLDNIEAILRELRASQSPAPVLKEISGLAPKEFARSLPALRRVGEQPVSAVRPAPAELHAVAQKLLQTNETTPNYWPTVLQFIKFASAGLSPDVPPPGQPNLSLHDVSIIGANVFGPISHKIVLLDGGKLVDQHFDHSRIIFTNNPIKMSNVTFVDCVFEMPISDTLARICNKRAERCWPRI